VEFWPPDSAYPAESGSATNRIVAMHGLQSANSRSLYNSDSESLLVIASSQIAHTRPPIRAPIAEPLKVLGPLEYLST
jgi:hypothetical protein